MDRPKTAVYIDGFNLYFRCLSRTPYKWLDLQKLCTFILPEYDVDLIRYFTARVESRPGDPGQQQRQQAYIRALRTRPIIKVHYGRFQTKPKGLPLSGPWLLGRDRRIQVMRTEEKGSDVNLASHLLADGFKGRYEVAVVVSNDSDLKEPIQIVRRELRLPVGVVITDPKTRQSGLPADFHRRISEAVLRSSQLPDTLTDPNGTVRKPEAWTKKRGRPKATPRPGHLGNRVSP